MTLLRSLALAGAAVLVIGGGAFVAQQFTNSRLLTVHLPDGSIEHIRYIGDVAPTVQFDPGAAPAAAWPVAAWPVAAFQPFFLSPFVSPALAQFDKISAMMDQQSAVMLQSLEQGLDPGAPHRLSATDVASMPAGVTGYSVVSTLSGSGVCTRSVEYASRGDGKPPRVLTRTSGACKGVGAPAVTAGAARAQAAPGLVETSYASNGVAHGDGSGRGR